MIQSPKKVKKKNSSRKKPGNGENSDDDFIEETDMRSDECTTGKVLPGTMHGTIVPTCYIP